MTPPFALAIRRAAVDDIYVRSAHRRNGYGRQLLRHVADIAFDRGCGRFEWSALDWNAPAVAFYRSLGAEQMDQWTTFRVTGTALARLAGAEG